MKLFLNILIAVLVIIGALIAVQSAVTQALETPQTAKTQTVAQPSASTSASLASGRFLMQIVDCGQGDCILVKGPGGETIVVDAGDLGTEDKILPQLKKQDVSTIDLLVATHPHADHIGAMKTLLETYDVKKVLLTDATQTTKTYLAILQTIKDKKIPKMLAKAGDTLTIGEIGIEILGPVKKYDDLNNMSIVMRLTYKNTRFLLTGDAENKSENDILKKFGDVKADVLKAGHHGSSTSTGKAFLAAINPKYAAISCGKGNDYGHPHKETLALFKKNKIDYFRTDLSGNIYFYSDGDTVTVQTER
jgi:competence protein ComEC